ncbi:MAG: class I SAM-dependent methyltransferase, partial [Patescibacteria group bacterium]
MRRKKERLPGTAPRDGYATFLDPLLARLRSRRIQPHIRRGSSLLDIGCGMGELLFGLADLLYQGVGIDQRTEDKTVGNIRLMAGRIDTVLPFADASFDAVSLLAVLEHLERPDAILREIRRVLRPGGTILITVPTIYAKPVLEFLAFRLHLISREGVADHKRYY